MLKKWGVFILSLLFLSSMAQSAPNTLHWQGKLYVNGVAYNGNANFKFALVSGNSIVWNSWTGTLVAPFPAANAGIYASNTPGGIAVVLPVTSGLYSTALGAAPMAALDPTLFKNALKLRVWVDSGAGERLLTPDDEMHAVPYALGLFGLSVSANSSLQLTQGVIVNNKQVVDAQGRLLATDGVTFGQTSEFFQGPGTWTSLWTAAGPGGGGAGVPCSGGRQYWDGSAWQCGQDNYATWNNLGGANCQVQASTVGSQFNTTCTSQAQGVFQVGTRCTTRGYASAGIVYATCAWDNTGCPAPVFVGVYRSTVCGSDTTIYSQCAVACGANYSKVTSIVNSGVQCSSPFQPLVTLLEGYCYCMQ